MKKREPVRRLGKDDLGQPHFKYRGTEFYRSDMSSPGYYGRYRCKGGVPPWSDSYAGMLDEIDRRIGPKTLPIPVEKENGSVPDETSEKK